MAAGGHRAGDVGEWRGARALSAFFGPGLVPQTGPPPLLRRRAGKGSLGRLCCRSAVYCQRGHQQHIATGLGALDLDFDADLEVRRRPVADRCMSGVTALTAHYEIGQTDELLNAGTDLHFVQGLFTFKLHFGGFEHPCLPRAIYAK